MSILAGLFARVWPYLLAGGAVLLVLAGAHGQGRRAAETAARKRELESAVRAAKARRDVEEAYPAGGGGRGGDVHERLHGDWSRD